jgi:hypothetical protein
VEGQGGAFRALTPGVVGANNKAKGDKRGWEGSKHGFHGQAV